MTAESLLNVLIWVYAVVIGIGFVTMIAWWVPEMLEAGRWLRQWGEHNKMVRERWKELKDEAGVG